MSHKIQQSTDGFPYDGRTQMTNVHLLCHIGGGEVNHNPQLSIDLRWADPIQHNVSHQLRDV